MIDLQKATFGHVIGPDGSVLSPASLPQTNQVRWVTRRKAELVAAIEGGLLSISQASERYHLSSEELIAWQRSYQKHGLAGLRACSRIQPFLDDFAPFALHRSATGQV